MRVHLELAALACLIPSLALGAPKSALTVPDSKVTTADDVKAACAAVQGCAAQPEFAAAVKFCALAQAGAPDSDPTPWSTTPVPKLQELRRACTAKTLSVAPMKEGVVAPSLKGLDQSAVLWGVTDFLLSRAELELRQWAIDGFLRSVCGKKLGNETLFAQSCQLVSGTHLPGLLPSMTLYQQAMRRDLAHLPVLATKDAAARAHSPRLADAAYVGMLLSHAVEGQIVGQAPVASLQYAATRVKDVQLSCTKQPLAARLFIVGSLLASLPRNTTPGSSDSIFLPTDAGDRAYALMALALNSSDPESSGIAGVFPTDCAAKGSNFKFDAVVLRSGLETVNSVLIEAAKASKKLADIPPDATPEVRTRAYAAVMAQVVDVTRKVLKAFPDLSPTAELDVVLTEMGALCQDLASGDYATAVVELAGVTAYIVAKETLPSDEFVRLSAFAADIAQAGTAEEASAALERFALPPGSYLRKRSATGGYFTVNAYVGGLAAAEWAQQQNGWHDASWGFSPGFWVPIGLEAGFGGKAGSLGLFAQAIDLGVLASWRVKNDDLQARPQVGFEQVFSPGLAVVWGIPRAPISVALVGALSPRLRVLKPSIDGARDDKRSAVRVGLAVGVDVPIFP